METTISFEQLLQIYTVSHTRRLRYNFRRVSGCSFIIQLYTGNYENWKFKTHNFLHNRKRYYLCKNHVNFSYVLTSFNVLVEQIGTKCVDTDRLLLATAVTGITKVPNKTISQKDILAVTYLTCHELWDYFTQIFRSSNCIYIHKFLTACI
jgi:hypothetical protein